MAFPVKAVHDIELERFKNDQTANRLYIDGKNLLKQSGILNILRQFGRPYAIQSGSNVYQSAYAAAHSEGYNKALDDILYFEEQYLQDMSNQRPVKADFGGLGLALARGDLTLEDINGKLKGAKQSS